MANNSPLLLLSRASHRIDVQHFSCHPSKMKACGVSYVLLEAKKVNIFKTNNVFFNAKLLVLVSRHEQYPVQRRYTTKNIQKIKLIISIIIII